jgi:hypothetical protein
MKQGTGKDRLNEAMNYWTFLTAGWDYSGFRRTKHSVSQ